MRTTALCLAVAASAFLLGCAVPGSTGGMTSSGGTPDRPFAPQHKAAKCKNVGSSCDVAVSVKCNGPACWLETNPDYISIAEEKKIKITWKIVTPGYKFDPVKGIVILDTPPLEFECKIDPSDAAKYDCSNKHSKFGVYKYNVTVTGGPVVVPTLDPWVIND